MRAHGLPEQSSGYNVNDSLSSFWECAGLKLFRHSAWKCWNLLRYLDIFQSRHVCLLLAHIPYRQWEALRKKPRISALLSDREKARKDYARVLRLSDRRPISEAVQLWGVFTPWRQSRKTKAILEQCSYSRVFISRRQFSYARVILVLVVLLDRRSMRPAQ